VRRAYPLRPLYAGAILEIDTPHGPARIHPDEEVWRAPAVLVLGHGAGGGVGAPDLLAAARAARSLGAAVVFVEQPYRVAGRRSPAPARQLDAAWLAVIGALRQRTGPAALIVGGRSSGARVACRTAADAGAAAVLCLAFPLHPPGRADDPAKSRLPELDAAGMPVLVVQGERDPFGMPPPGPGRTVVAVAADHSLRRAEPVRAAVSEWLAPLVQAFREGGSAGS
jgi:hypothetical protein